MKDSVFIDRINNWNDYIDSDLTEEECLMYQLNHDNHTRFDLNDIEFGVPEQTKKIVINYHQPNEDITTNTKVLVTAKVGSEFRGSDYYHYRRLDLDTQWRLLNRVKEILLPDDLEDLDRIKILIARKMPIRKDSIVVTHERKQGQRYLNIKPIDHSLLYIGSVSILRKDVNSPMSKIRRSQSICGFDYQFDSKLIISNGFHYK